MSTRRRPPSRIAILTYNRGRSSGLADGIVITPSHNPPDSGGFKYNPPNGGPADSDVDPLDRDAGERFAGAWRGRRQANGAYSAARRAATTHPHDYLQTYVQDLGSSLGYGCHHATRKIRMGVDPLGGAGVHYWPRIAERYRPRS